MRKLVQAFLVVTAIVMLSTGGMVHAQSNGIGITPRKDFTVKPGAHVSDTLFVSNLSQNQELRVSIRVVDFKAQDESGTPALQLAANAPQTPWSLKPFIKIAGSVTVAAGKSTYVPFTVAIPSSQGAGSYYSAIEYVAENAATQQKVNIAASSASLVFVAVPGQAKEQLAMEQFGAYAPNKDEQTGVFKSWFIGSQPQQLAYRLTNHGNVAEQPAGAILIKNIFGKEVKQINKANPKNQLALIDQTRRFQTCIVTEETTNTTASGQTNPQIKCVDPGLAPGRYTAQLALFYGLNGSNTQEIAATATFWYLPWWFVGLLVLVVVAIAVLVWWLRRQMSKRGKAKRR
ncbi:MAG TPA: hypothetical protein VMY99_02610 [Nevskiaceae bacterium]|nr:hypothetical protein [Nevskiaceae bacterium]